MLAEELGIGLGNLGFSPIVFKAQHVASALNGQTA
jgi:hypothetical protein